MLDSATPYPCALEVLRSTVDASVEDFAAEIGLGAEYLRRVENGTWPFSLITLGNLVRAYAAVVSQRSAVDATR